MPIDLSINLDLDPEDPNNYDGIPMCWDSDQPKIFHPDEENANIDQYEVIDSYEEDYAL